MVIAKLFIKNSFDSKKNVGNTSLKSHFALWLVKCFGAEAEAYPHVRAKVRCEVLLHEADIDAVLRNDFDAVAKRMQADELFINAAADQKVLQLLRAFEGYVTGG